MTIIAEFRVTGSDVALLGALQAVPDMRLDLERSLVGESGAIDLFIWAHGDNFERFEAAMADDPTVVSAEVIANQDGERLYRIQPSREETVDLVPLDREVGASRLAAWATADGLLRRTRFPDRSAMRRHVEGLRQVGLDVSLITVYRGGEAFHRDRYDISEKQLRALQEALRAGYYAVPREADLSTVADRLGISRQAASERLRRGTAAILRHTVGRFKE